MGTATYTFETPALAMRFVDACQEADLSVLTYSTTPPYTVQVLVPTAKDAELASDLFDLSTFHL